MKAFEASLNRAAVEVAIESLFGKDGLAKVTAAYTMIDVSMAAAYNTGREEAEKLDSAKIEQIRMDEFKRGYQMAEMDYAVPETCEPDAAVVEAFEGSGKLVGLDMSTLQGDDEMSALRVAARDLEANS